MSSSIPINENVLSVRFWIPGDNSQEAEVYRSLGMFIANYAKAEAALHMFARRALGVSDSIGRHIFAGSRISEILNKVSHILPETETQSEKIAEFNTIAMQFRRIAEVRHLIVHNGVEFPGASSVLTHKKFVSRVRESFQVRKFSSGEIEALVDDTGWIVVRLIALAEPEFTKEFEGAAWERARDMAYAPWRYNS